MVAIAETVNYVGLGNLEDYVVSLLSCCSHYVRFWEPLGEPTSKPQGKAGRHERPGTACLVREEAGQPWHCFWFSRGPSSPSCLPGLLDPPLNFGSAVLALIQGAQPSPSRQFTNLSKQ